MTCTFVTRTRSPWTAAILVFLLLPGAVPATERLTVAHAGFTDTMTVILYSRGAKVGTCVSSLASDGSYRRMFAIQAGPQLVEMRMVIEPDETGVWKLVHIENPAFGNRTAERDGRTVSIRSPQGFTTATLPDDYILYDDFGNVWESVMFARYDMTKKGRQQFQRFRIPETPMPGEMMSVEIEYSGEKQVDVQGRVRIFRLFKWRLAGQEATYWLDSGNRVCYVESPAEQSVAVREGCEDLLQPPATGAASPRSPSGILRSPLSVPMRDGIGLATDLYRPDEQGTLPLILLRTPYGRNSADMEAGARFYAAQGYAVAVQDVRGRGESGGEWEPYLHEAEDGFDAIEYLAGQPWCSGRVGMLGGSYLAWTQVWAARLRPPHLAAIIPHNLPAEPFRNSPFENGAFLMTPQLWWTGLIEAGVTDLNHPRFREVEAIKQNEQLSSLPVIDLDTRILGREVPYWRAWILHNADGPYWKNARYLESMKDLSIPVLLQSGWFDTQSIGTRLAWEALRESRSRCVRLVIGPWNHVNQVPRSEAARNVGPEGTLDLARLHVRWFDRWLKGIDNGVDREPAVQVYLLNSGQWITGDRYPAAVPVKLFLSSTHGANTLKGDGRLLWKTAAGGKEFDEYVYSPADPTPAPAARFGNGRKGFDEITSRRQDILVYESEPLEDTVTVCGPIQSTMYASSSTVDTDWFVTLYAVTEAGRHVPMVRGAMRARFRNSLSAPELLDPGRIYEYAIDLWHFGITLRKGWRIRVEIASAYFPEFSRNLNTGGNNETETVFVEAVQKIHHSAAYPSHILLPVRRTSTGVKPCAASDAEGDGQ